MLKYIGNGWIHGVPARDLTDEEAKKHGKKRLLASGLYIEEKPTSEVKHGIESTTQDSTGG